MEKFIPYEKLSKKEQRRLNSARRGTWGALSPVTRKPQSSKAYNRKRTQAWKKDVPYLRSSYLICKLIKPSRAYLCRRLPGESLTLRWGIERKSLIES